MIILPAIDLRGGRVVRLSQGDFARERRFDTDPVRLAGLYAQAGARRLHAVDLDGARAGEPAQLPLLQALADTGLAVQWGGGVRCQADIEAVLAAGARRVVVGSMAVREPGRFAQWLGRYGERLVLALDLRADPAGRWQPTADAWRASIERDIEALLDGFAAAGLRWVLSTDIARDGMAGGPNLDLYAWLAGRWPMLSVIASGGVRDAADVQALAGTGAAACVAGTALLEGTLPASALAAHAGPAWVD